MQILEGIKVTDMAQFISGTRCTQILADMGADVVHIESLQGDTMRLWINLVGGSERSYSLLNRNKHGIAVDWQNPEGQEVIRKVIAESDVFVHNLIPGTMEKYGLGYEDIRKLKPDIVYVAISGFGTDSIYPERAVFDIIAQAEGGQFWLDPKSTANPVNPWADYMSGAYGAISTLLAIIHKLRTGEGQFVDLSMQDVMYFNNHRATANKLLGPDLDKMLQTMGRDVSDILNSTDRMPFYSFFKSKDANVVIVAFTPRQWRDLMEIIGQPKMADDPNFSNLLGQIKNNTEAVERIESWTQQYSSTEVIEKLRAKKIPCALAYNIEQVNSDENLKHRQMFKTVQHEDLGVLDVPGIPFKFSKSPGSVRAAAPRLGEHNEKILKEWLNYSPEEIDALRKNGVIKG